MAMKKTTPKKTEPKPPTPRQTAMTSTKSTAKKASPAAGAMGKKVAAKSAKETSAKTRGMADAYKKTGAGYMKQTYNSAAGDLSGRGRMLNAKDEFFAYPVYADNGRTSQRAKDQAKRKKK
jgi:hypothetical protein